jgi:hypothetical protein
MLEAGKFADLFVVGDNPLHDIRNTRKVRLVMKAGQVYDPVELLAAVRGRFGPTRAEDDVKWKRPGS